MKIFVADGNNRIRATCKQHNIGILSSPSYFTPPPKDMDYILDNGAYRAWIHKEEWNNVLFYKVIDRLCDMSVVPYFVVIPDIVAGGLVSLKHSELHMDNLPIHWKKYLPVQPGMAPGDIDTSGVDGIFIGGGNPVWLWRTARDWCTFAHTNNIFCHIGRIGTTINYIRANSCGADSVDGSGPTRNNRLDIPINYLQNVKNQQTRLIL